MGTKESRLVNVLRPSLPAGAEQTSDTIIQYNTVTPGNGQPNRVDDSAGFETYGYDGLGRQTSRNRVINGSSATYTTSYEYNAINQQTSITYPSNKKVRANYDSRGRLVGMDKMNGAVVALSYLSQMIYNVAGQLTGLTLGNGVVESYGYSADRLQLISQSAVKGAATLMSLTYNYAASAGASGTATTSGNSSQLMSVSGSINGQSRNQAFTYDNVGRLKTSTGWTAGQNRRYEYDRWGNRNGVWDATVGGNQIQSVTLQQSGGAPTNRIASVNSVSYVYDAVGNLTNDGEHTYRYDAESRLVKVDNGSAATYSYDAANRRVKKQTPQGTTYYIWEGGVVIAEYIEGQPQGAGGVKYYLADKLSTRLTTNSSGGVLGTQDHLPFGEEAGVSGEVEKHRFTNYERDDETESDYAVNRQYSQQTGRFMRPDPVAGTISNPQSLNRYGYAVSDPINLIDPLGLDIKINRCLNENGEEVPCNSPGAIPAGDDVIFFPWNPLVPDWSSWTRALFLDGLGLFIRAQQAVITEVKTIKKRICDKIPSGRTIGASVSVGAVGSVVGGGEVVLNYESGQISAFGFGGTQVGWNGGGSAQVYSGYIYGLNSSNSNYSEGFTGIHGTLNVPGSPVTGGLFATGSSAGLKGGPGKAFPVKQPYVVGQSVGVGIPGTGRGTLVLSSTEYSKPRQLGKYWAFALNPKDTLLFGAKQACK